MVSPGKGIPLDSTAMKRKTAAYPSVPRMLLSVFPEMPNSARESSIQGGPRLDQVGADMPAGDPMGNARDRRLRHGGLEEVELAPARVAIPQRHGEDSAVVLGNQEGAVRARLEVREVAVLIQDPGQDADPIVERLPLHALASRGQAALRAAIEEANEQIWVLVIDVFQ